jgi:hypothetical protein
MFAGRSTTRSEHLGRIALGLNEGCAKRQGSIHVYLFNVAFLTTFTVDNTCSMRFCIVYYDGA